jgi:methylthioribose-1-phosphate isomerase
VGRRDLTPEQIIRLEAGRVVLLDQRRLPGEEVELECRTAADVADAIKTLAIRGAPAIGVAAAYGYALAVEQGGDLDEADRVLRASRPTAVNLAWALDRMREEPSPDTARRIHADEVERCRRMAEHALELFEPRTCILTHCNTGGLATGGYGTALGAIRLGWERGLVRHVWVNETRPLLQGARLTAWELEQVGVSFSVVVDASAGSLMAAGQVDAVLTGADRIAANGDTANKIGTYGLAVLALHHSIPFVVVAPTSTIDHEIEDGGGIPIEERSPDEVTTRFPARNPAFDLTEARLISAIVTERGVHRPPYAETLPFEASVA